MHQDPFAALRAAERRRIARREALQLFALAGLLAILSVAAAYAARALNI